jgi:uncharacterized protein involved in type VI secretion and phage assembly
MALDEITLTSPKITLDGQELPDSWLLALTEVRVEREFRLPGRVSLRFSDFGYELLKAAKVKLGDPLVVSVLNSSQLIDAEVTGISSEQRVGDQPELVIVGHDKSHRLGRATRVATYLQVTYSDIVSQLASKNGMTAAADATAGQLEYLLQVDSDMELLNEIADRVGFDWWAEGTTLNFKKPAANPKAVKVTMNQDLMAFSVRATGHRPDTVKVDGWDRKKQEPITGQAAASEAAIKAESTIADLVSAGKTPFGSATLQTAALSAESNDEAAQLSNAIVSRGVASSVTAKGVCDANPDIKPGATVEVVDAGPLSGKYHVTRVEHTYRASGFETRFYAGDRTPTTLVDTLGGSRQSGAMAGSFDHPGLVVGEVTNINDPDQKGRIKVRYPGLSGTEESHWARICILGGGKDRGSVFIPEVKDEVLVGFEGGDLRQPVVIGGLYGEKSGIPKWAVDDGKVSARQITSRLGHTIALSDGDGDAEQFVSIVLAGEKHKIRLGKDKTDVEIPSGQELTIKAGDTKIAFNASGDINIEGNNINIKAKQNIKLESQMDTEVKATMNLKLDGAVETKIHGANVGVEADATATIKGSAMVKIN